MHIWLEKSPVSALLPTHAEPNQRILITHPVQYSVCMYVCLPDCLLLSFWLFVWPSVWLSFCLSVCLSVQLSVCMVGCLHPLLIFSSLSSYSIRQVSVKRCNSCCCNWTGWSSHPNDDDDDGCNFELTDWCSCPVEKKSCTNISDTYRPPLPWFISIISYISYKCNMQPFNGQQ